MRTLFWGGEGGKERRGIFLVREEGILFFGGGRGDFLERGGEGMFFFWVRGACFFLKKKRDPARAKPVYMIPLTQRVGGRSTPLNFARYSTLCCHALAA